MNDTKRKTVNDTELDKNLGRLNRAVKDYVVYMGAGKEHSLGRILEYSREIFRAAGMTGRRAAILKKELLENKPSVPIERVHNFSHPLPSMVESMMGSAVDLTDPMKGMEVDDE